MKLNRKLGRAQGRSARIRVAKRNIFELQPLEQRTLLSTTTTLEPIADAYVRSDTHATTNFGAETNLVAKTSASANLSRNTYLKFDLSSTTSVSSATLRLYGNLSDPITENLTLAAYQAGNTTWVENTITWNTQPNASGGALATVVVTDNTPRWYELNLTTFVQAQKALGNTLISMQLKGPAGSTSYIGFNSKEATSNDPELVVVSVDPPTAPSGLSATATSAATVNLSWTDNASTETGFKVERKIGTGGSWSEVASLAANTTAYTDYGRTASTEYVYRVTAYNAGGNSSYTGEATATTPASPGQVALVPTADAYVRNGTYATQNFGSATDLVIKSTTAANLGRNAYLKFDVSTIASLTSAKLRLYGQLSDAITENLTLTAYQAANTTWVEGSINWNNQPETATAALATVVVPDNTPRWYELDLTDFVQAQRAAGQNVISIELKGPLNSTSYIGFASSNASANVPELVVVSVAAPTAPSDLTAVATSPTAIALDWTDNSTDETGFIVQRSTDGSTWTTVTTTAADVVTFADSGLTANTSYSYCVRATNAGGASTNATASATTRTVAPSGFSASGGDGEVSLGWAATAGASSYNVYRSTTSGSGYVKINGSAVTDLEYTDGGRTNGTAYYYVITSVNAGGESAYSAEATATPSATSSAPNAPGSLVANASSPSTIAVAWADNSSNEDGFKIERKIGSGGSWSQIATAAANATSYTDTGLDVLTEYVYRVRAYAGAANSSYSGEATATIGMSVAPSADAYVENSSVASTNFGTSTELRVKHTTGSNIRHSYLTFDLNALTGGIQAAKIRLYGGMSGNEELPISIYAVPSVGWSEGTINWNNKPASDATALATTTVTYGTAQWYEWDVTSYVSAERIAGRNVVGFVIRTSTTSVNYASFHSKEASSEPAGLMVIADAQTIPSAPSSASATASSTTQVTVSWTDNSSNETGFKVERKIGASGTWSEIATVAANVTSYADTGLAQSTPYIYRVRAYSGAGPSSSTSEVTATIQPATTEIILDNTSGSVAYTGTWTSSTTDAGYYGTNYRHDGNTGKGTRSVKYTPTIVEVGEYEVFAWYPSTASRSSIIPVDVVDANGTTTITLNETTNGSPWVSIGTYDFAAGTDGYVRIRNDGTGNYVVADAIRFLKVASQNQPPTAPTNFSATTISSSSVDLIWDDNASNESGFVIEMSTDGTNYDLLEEAGPDEESYLIENLDSATTYWFRVKSINSYGSSTWVLLTASTACVAPSLPDATIGLAQVTLSWATTAGADAYNLYRSDDAGNSFEKVNGSPIFGDSYVDDTVEEGQAYHYAVTALRANTESERSVDQQVEARWSPISPSNFSVSRSSATSLLLTWHDESGGTDSFVIQRQLSEGAWDTIITTDPGTEYYLDTGLASSSPYVYRVISSRFGETAMPSVSAGATTFESSPSAPTQLNAAVMNATSIVLTWQDTAATEIGFRIERSSDGNVFTTLATLPTNSTTYKDSSASRSTTYHYRVRAYSDAGGAGVSNTATITTPQTFIPAMPGNIQAAAPLTSRVEVTWDLVSEYHVGYDVEVTDIESGTTRVVQAGANEAGANVTGLTASSEYSIRVRTRGVDGSSSYSSSVTATTPLSSLPDAPRELVVASSTGTTNVLSWTSDADIVSGYIIERSEDGVEFAEVGTTTSEETTYTDIVVDGTAYQYRVRTENSNGESEPSLPESTVVAPINAAVSWGEFRSFDVTWRTIQGGEDGFRIEISADGINYTLAGIAAPNSYHFPVTGLADNTKYVARVAAFKAGIVSSYAFAENRSRTGNEATTLNYSPVWNYVGSNNVFSPGQPNWWNGQQNLPEGDYQVRYLENGWTDGDHLAGSSGYEIVTGLSRIQIPGVEVSYEGGALPDIMRLVKQASNGIAIDFHHSGGPISLEFNGIVDTATGPQLTTWTLYRLVQAPIPTNILSVSATPNTSTNDGSLGNFTVSRTGPINEDLTFAITLSGTAIAGLDYAEWAQHIVTEPTYTHGLRDFYYVSIPAGESSIDFQVDALPGRSIEEKTVTLSLLDGSTNSGGQWWVGSEAIATLKNPESLVSLTVHDSTHPTNSVTNGSDLYLAEGADGTVNIDISGSVMPDTFGVRRRALWRIDEPNAYQSQGNFSQSNSNIELTVVDNNRLWTVSAGYDINDNGNLDSSEVARSTKIHVVKLDALTVSASLFSERTITDDGSGPANDLYIGANGGSAIIKLDAAIKNDTDEARSHVLWAIEGAHSSISNPGNFEVNPTEVTLSPHISNTNSKFIVRAGIDLDGNGQLGHGEFGEPNEITREIVVYVVAVEDMFVSDVALPTNIVTAHDSNPIDFLVMETASGDAQVKIDVTHRPQTLAAGSQILYRIDEPGAFQSQGTFGAAIDPVVTLTPFGDNREFTIKLGFDDNANGNLDAGEIERTTKIYVVPILNIQISTFIKYEWVDGPPFSGVIYEGDNRIAANGQAIFGRNINAFRTRQTVKAIALDSYDSDGIQTGSIVNTAGTSIEYDKTSSVTATNNISAAANADTILGDGTLKTAVGTATMAGSTITATRVSDRKIKLTFDMAENNPLVGLSPDIDYDFELLIDYSDPATPVWQLTGTHDGFPCYEVYMNNQPLLQHDSQSETVFSLFPPQEKSVDKTGVIEP